MATPLFLCLACSSSPPPKPGPSAPFTTACCARPICERCLTKNPRLRGYHPCLACLGGTAVVDKSRSGKAINGQVYVTAPGPSGRSREQENDMFVLADDSDEDEDGAGVHDGGTDAQSPPAYREESEASTTTIADDETLVADAVTQESQVSPHATGSSPSRYYIQRGDTLMGIALRYGVDGHTICQLNSLPLSTLSTTPHLLHTRTSLVLPPTRHPLPPPPDPEVLEARTRERAEKRFQFVTKEVDWRVAKTYVSLAESEDEMAKSKEDMGTTQGPGKSALEARAVDQYLDDEEWEARQSGGPHLEGFPPFAARKDKTSRETLTSKLIN